MSSRRIRDGKGKAAYKRKRAALKRRTREENLPCGYGSPHGFGCGEPIDTTLDRRHPMSFTADHITPLAHGGHLLGPLVPMHLSCNSRKGDNLPAEIWEAS